MLGNFLLGAVRLHKNANLDKDGLDDTKLNAEKQYFINFAEQQEKPFLSLHHNGLNSYIFVNGIEICEFTPEESEINAASVCLGNVSKDFSVNNIKSALYRYVYCFQLVMIVLVLVIFQISMNI